MNKTNAARDPEEAEQSTSPTTTNRNRYDYAFDTVSDAEYWWRKEEMGFSRAPQVNMTRHEQCITSTLYSESDATYTGRSTVGTTDADGRFWTHYNDDMVHVGDPTTSQRQELQAIVQSLEALPEELYEEVD